MMVTPNCEGAWVTDMDSSARKRSGANWCLGLVLLALVLAASLLVSCTSKTGTTSDMSTWSKAKASKTWPAPRMIQSMVYDSTLGRIVMHGGVSGDASALTDVWTYDSTENKWTKLASGGRALPPSGLLSTIYDPDINALVALGGEDTLTDVWTYDLGSETWTMGTVSGLAPSRRSGASVLYVPSLRKVLMFGGFGADTPDTSGGPPHYLGDLWALDPVSDTWTLIAPQGSLPAPRANQSMAYDPGTATVLVFGGETRASGASGQTKALALSDTWSYAPATETWTELKPAGEAPLPGVLGAQSGALVYAPDLKAMILCHWVPTAKGTYIWQTWSYSSGRDQWTPMPAAGTMPAVAIGTSVVYDERSRKIVVFGGSRWDGPSPKSASDTSLVLLNDVWLLTLPDTRATR